MAAVGDDQSHARDTRAGAKAERRRRPPAKGLADAVRTARTRAGLSQRGLAKAADLSQSMISLIESGRRGIGIPALRRVASAVGMSSDVVERLRRKVRNARRRRRRLRRLAWRGIHEPELMARRPLARIDRASGRRGKGGRPKRRRFTRR